MRRRPHPRGDGDDALFDGENRRGSRDVLLGGDGGDLLFLGNKLARQGVGDGGVGRDTAPADRTDVLIDCERVLFRPPTGKVFADLFERFFAAS